MKRKSWNAYSKEEEKMIIELRKAGKSTSEIAYALGRSPKAVSLKITHMKANGKMEGLYVDGVKVAEVNSNLIEKSEPKVVERVREMSPREMIKKLYDLGYRIENNSLVCYVKQTVKLQDILAGGE